MVILQQDYFGKGNSRKFFWKTDGKSSKLGLLRERERGLFLSVYVDDIKMEGKKQNLEPMWKELMKDVHLGEPTSFSLTMSISVAPNENAKQAKIL